MHGETYIQITLDKFVVLRKNYDSVCWRFVYDTLTPCCNKFQPWTGSQEFLLNFRKFEVSHWMIKFETAI